MTLVIMDERASQQTLRKHSISGIPNIAYTIVANFPMALSGYNDPYPADNRGLKYSHNLGTVIFP